MIALIVRGILPLCGLCAAMLGVTVLVGAAMPTAWHLSIVTDNTCALPCVYGIMPGISTRDQASRLFDRSALSFTMLSEVKPASILRESDSSRSMMVRIDFSSASSNIVHSVQIYQISTDYNLGFLSDLLLAGYEPRRVYAACGDANRMILVLNDQGLYVQVMPEAQLTPNHAIMLLGVTTDGGELSQTISSFGCTAESDWMGFASQWKYQPAF
jgi:hypothetical protein